MTLFRLTHAHRASRSAGLLLAQSSPIFVKIPPTKHDDAAGLADVLIGSLGLTGAIVLLAVIAAGIFAGILIWFRSRSV